MSLASFLNRPGSTPDLGDPLRAAPWPPCAWSRLTGHLLTLASVPQVSPLPTPTLHLVYCWPSPFPHRDDELEGRVSAVLFHAVYSA